MKTSVLFIAITIMWTSVFAQMKDNQQLIYEFDKLLASEFKPDEPGAVVLISKKGEVIYKKALGMAHLELNQPMQMDNVFWIASIGKQFTAIAILQLMEQGKLNLQDEVTRFLPDYPTQGTNITIEHLLTHTSGIHNFSGMPDPEKKAVVVHLTTKKLNGIEIWQKTNLPLPDSNGIKVDSKIHVCWRV
jgi:CubicO group peptidase (beta-lactamase class C family)